ncbi:Ferredoxin [Lachnospiraceae bacterium TWA4]|nr:Ferredoxin [Lachnospiraceae bacterium TWA4]
MDKAKVYFTDFRTKLGVPLTEKLQKLCKKAGITDIDMEGKFTAIKMHFGELGNLAYLRPNYAKAVADIVKEQGGIPFLTDCNTLYPGSRKNALEHLDCANINGFNTITTGCQIIIGDGLRGTDDIAVPVKNGEYCEEAYIGRAVMDADVFISLNHFKGHEAAGFGGAIKNIGMGCGSRAGKMHQHNFGKPHVNEKLCRACKRCAKECGSDAIFFDTGKAVINEDICKGCGRCIGACGYDAISNNNDNANEVLGCKMSEYTMAVCDGRPCFHITLITDVSPNCDCHGENDAPILPNIGMLASFDPVALDQACVDLCQQATPIKNSQLGENMAAEDFHDHGDVWHNSNPNVAWKETLEHAEKIGLGTRDYELITMK